MAGTVLVPGIERVPCRREYLFEIVKLWRLSMQQALDIPQWRHTHDDVVGHLDAHFGSRDVAGIDVAMHMDSSVIAGFMEQDGSEIHNLYIAPAHQRRGIGQALIVLAKRRSPALLELYTFQRNTRARRFYEGVGFEIVARGRADARFNPWATTPEQLDDLRYRWVAPRE